MPTKESIIKQYRVARMTGDLSARPMKLELVKILPHTRVKDRFIFRSKVNGKLETHRLKKNEFEPILTDIQKKEIADQAEQCKKAWNDIAIYTAELISKRPMLGGSGIALEARGINLE